jgi:hypothetical protein
VEPPKELSSATIPSTSNPSPDDPHWLHRRGLNKSFLEAIQSILDKDPCASLNDLGEQYQAHFKTIETNYPKSIKESKSSTPSTLTGHNGNGASIVSPSPFNFSVPKPMKDAPGSLPKVTSDLTKSTPVFQGFNSASSDSTSFGNNTGFKFDTTSKDSSTVNPNTKLSSPFSFSFNPPAATGGITGKPTATFTLPTAQSAEKESEVQDPVGADENDPQDIVADEPTQNALLGPGMGLEGEEIALEVRGRLYELIEGSWQTLGVAPFTIRKNEASQRSRLVMQIGSSGKPCINSFITSVVARYAPDQPKKVTLAIVCGGSDSDAPEKRQYSLALKLADDAKRIVDLIQELKGT